VTRHGTYPTAAANAVELRVEKIAQLFHSLDPFPFREKDLDNDVEEFIVGWARELPPDKPLGIVIHLPETEASTSENSVQLSLNILTVAPESLRSILTSSFASADQRWTLASRHFLSHHRPNSSQPCTGCVSSKRACLFSDRPRIGGQSKYFCTTGGRSFDGANLYQRLSAAHVKLRPYRNVRLRGKPMLTNEAQPADQLSDYTPYSELEPFRIDPAVMGMFDPDYRDLARGPGVFQLRDRWSLSGAGTHDGVGSPQPNAWAAPPIPPGAKSGLGYHDVARAEWSRGRFITRSSG